MMLPLILTCSCPSSAAALPRRSPANWESCSAYCVLPTDRGRGGTRTTTAGLGWGCRAPIAELQGQNRGEGGGCLLSGAGLTGAPRPRPGAAGLSIPGTPRDPRTPTGTGVVSAAFSGPARPLACGGVWQKGGRRGGPSQAAGIPLFCTTFPPRSGEGRSGESCTARVACKAADRHRASSLRWP